jgi:hypothetical protein
LQQILPQIDQDIANLQAQQKQLIQNFNQQVSELQAGGTVLQQWYKTWVDINKQVKDYLDAGGSQATAQTFLQLQYQNQILQIKDQLNQADDQAVQDAISLNGLLQQRTDMMKQEAETEFGILTADSLERRESYAVTAAQQLQLQRDQYNKQLNDLNAQITLTQQKVNMESQVFDIAKNINDLHAQDAALQAQALAEQIAQYKEMQSIIANGVNFSSFFNNGQFNPNFVPGVNPAAGTGPSAIVTINIGDTNKNAKEIASEIRNELRLLGRYGMTQFA